MTTSAETSVRELARRVNGGLEISLYWNAGDNSTSVEVYEPSTEETITFRVPPGQALEAFYHPFAYLPDPLHYVYLFDNSDDFERNSDERTGTSGFAAT
jgi:hypothetical protein